MTKIEYKIIKNSFNQILPIADAAARLFYLKLFELDPELEKLFDKNMEKQGDQFVCLIENAIHYLNNRDMLLPTLKSLGARHEKYNVKPRDYDTAELALMWMLEQVLDKDFTPRVRSAWQAFYDLISSTMKSGITRAA